MLATILSIVGWVVELVAKIWTGKQKQEDATRADAAQAALGTVGDSLQVEDSVHEAHDAVDNKPSNVATPDGGLNFDEWNSGKKEGNKNKEEKKDEKKD